MHRVLFAGLLAIAVLFTGSVSVIAWWTDPEQPRVSAPEPSWAHAAIPDASPPVPAATSPRAAAAVAAPVAAPPSPAQNPPTFGPPVPAFVRGRVTAEEASRARADDAPRRSNGKRMPTRAVASARDRHLRAAHPDFSPR